MKDSEILNDEKFVKEFKSGREHFRDYLLVHSATSAKGLEFPVIILYKFASNPVFRSSLQSLLKEENKEELIKIRFAFSRLYVSITRAVDHLYFIEDEEGEKFWKHALLENSYGEKQDFFKYSPISQSQQNADFETDIEASVANYDKYISQYLLVGARSNLQFAILIARALEEENRLSLKFLKH